MVGNDFIPGDARVSSIPVDRSGDAVGMEGPIVLVDCSCQFLPWPWVNDFEPANIKMIIDGYVMWKV